jgi:hypothetical protein
MAIKDGGWAEKRKYLMDRIYSYKESLGCQGDGCRTKDFNPSRSCFVNKYGTTQNISSEFASFTKRDFDEGPDRWDRLFDEIKEYKLLCYGCLSRKRYLRDMAVKDYFEKLKRDEYKDEDGRYIFDEGEYMDYRDWL